MFKADYSDLVASRICHDLINPVGAIGNGVELLEMAGRDDPEVQLISDGISNTSARLRLFRIAFGKADPKQMLSAQELQSIFANGLTERLYVDWRDTYAHSRSQVKAVLLAILCMERALPRGGMIDVTYDNGWHIAATADIIDADENDWKALSDCQAPETVTAHTVPFGLLPSAIKDIGMLPTVLISNTRLSVHFD